MLLGSTAAARRRNARSTEPVVVENRDGAGRFVIVCDHASNRLSAGISDLSGSRAAERAAHIAWDPGALGVARHLSRQLDAPLVHCTVSRLVIDCNRALDAPDLIADAQRDNADPRQLQHLTEASASTASTPFTRRFTRRSSGDRRSARRGPRDGADRASTAFTPVYRGVSRPWESASSSIATGASPMR